MKYYSTRHSEEAYSAREATSKGLANDSGLFMPEFVPELNQSFLDAIKGRSFQEIALEVSKVFFADDLEEGALQKIVTDAYDFKCPLTQLEENLYVLELFHGPTLAFKDYGARFLARILSAYRKDEGKELTILVATSGDTGSAVASGFYKVPGIKVVILYPSNKVSPLQEQQLTTLGENITALEVQGTFDDCQRLVKEAFLDKDLNLKLDLTSANSINIGRFIPQSFYYFYAASQLEKSSKDIVFSVPSGNLGNLTAGLFAKKMGLKVDGFISALNSNNVFEKYLNTGVFTPRASVKTVANAMDVGNPSNLERISALYNNDIEAIRRDIKSASFSDEQILSCIQEVNAEYYYLMCPHTATGLLAYLKYKTDFKDSTGIVLATAHPAKFIDQVEPVIGEEIKLPPELAVLKDKKKESVVIDSRYDSLKFRLINDAR